MKKEKEKSKNWQLKKRRREGGKFKMKKNFKKIYIPTLNIY